MPSPPVTELNTEETLRRGLPEVETVGSNVFRFEVLSRKEERGSLVVRVAMLLVGSTVVCLVEEVLVVEESSVDVVWVDKALVAASVVPWEVTVAVLVPMSKLVFRRSSI